MANYIKVGIDISGVGFLAGIKETLREWKGRKPKGTKYFFNTIKGGQLSARYLCDMIKRYGRKAKIDNRISPHTLRHTFATEYYRQTKDIETLRRILGHSDISTTTIYITLAYIDVENRRKSFKAFSILGDSINNIKNKTKPDLKMIGLVFNFADLRSFHARNLIDFTRKTFGEDTHHKYFNCSIDQSFNRLNHPTDKF
jgi:hypothetical protein